MTYGLAYHPEGEPRWASGISVLKTLRKCLWILKQKYSVAWMAKSNLLQLQKLSLKKVTLALYRVEEDISRN